MAAEGPLHDLGAIQIVNSDSQGMGRIGETVRRRCQLADAMKAGAPTRARRRWPAEPADDNDRVLRYLAKRTAEPAIAHGIADEVGSLAPGRLADIVLWEPASFGVRPLMVIKGGRRRLERDGRGQRQSSHGAAAHALRPGLGRRGRRGRAAVDDVRLAAALDAGFAATTARRVVAGPRHPRAHPRREPSSRTDRHAARPHRCRPVDGTVTLDGRVLACEPTTPWSAALAPLPLA